MLNGIRVCVNDEWFNTIYNKACCLDISLLVKYLASVMIADDIASKANAINMTVYSQKMRHLCDTLFEKIITQSTLTHTANTFFF